VWVGLFCCKAIFTFQGFLNLFIFGQWDFEFLIVMLFVFMFDSVWCVVVIFYDFGGSFINNHLHQPFFLSSSFASFSTTFPIVFGLNTQLHFHPPECIFPEVGIGNWS
jgi:hypothetical protein